MRAVVYRGVNDLRVETVPVPRIGPNELLVKVAVCGVCPTDIKKIQYGTVPPPRIFGHETAGTIVRIGGGASVLASRFKIGNRVALHHHVPCLDCHFCRHHAFAQCETYKRTGITAGFEPAGGGYAEYVRVMPFVLPGVVKIPVRNSFAEGAMLEPVNTVLKAVRRLSLLRGDVVLVAGQGPIGLMFTRLLQLAGAQVIATDLLEPRLRLARKFGAKWILLAQTGRAELPQLNPGRAELPLRPDARQRVPTSTLNPQPSTFIRLSSLIRRATRGRGLDAAVIAVPSDAVVQQALQLVRGGGQVLLFAHTKRTPTLNPQPPGAPKCDEGGRPGEGSQNSTLNPTARRSGAKAAQPPVLHSLGEGGSTLNFPLDLASVCLDEKDLLGSYSSDFTLQDEVARLVFSRQLDVRDLISHFFPLEQTPAAIRLASKPTEDSLKILVTS
jgi:L-iditol 2-dehydrogenase